MITKDKPKRPSRKAATLPDKFREGLRERKDTMMDGDFFEVVCSAVLEDGFLFKSDIKFNSVAQGARGKRFAKGKTKIAVYHAQCMGEFTDMQFEV